MVLIEVDSDNKDARKNKDAHESKKSHNNE